MSFIRLAVGDSVSEDEVVGEVETDKVFTNIIINLLQKFFHFDKTSVPIHSPVAGVIEELLVEDGSTVQPGKVILRIRVGAQGAKPSKENVAAATPSQAETPKEKPVVAAEVKSTPPSPPPQESSSKPLSTSKVSSVKSSAENLASSSDSSSGGQSRKETRVKINRMRQRIAQRLKDAQNTYAMLTTFNEVDMR